MDFRHNAARRRRVMRDERLEVERPVLTESIPQPFRRYQTATVLACQPAILDLVPKASWLNRLCVASALAIAVGLLLLPLPVTGADSFWTALFSRPEWWSIEHPGSLGQMFLMMLSVFNVGLCYQIYHLRRHRGDDYHGAYQIWRWATLPAVVLAVMGTTVPAAILGFFLGALIPAQFTALGTGLVLGVGGVFLTALLARLYFEIRESRWATVFLGATTITAMISLTLIWNRIADVWTLPSNSFLSPTSWWLMSVASAYGMLLSYFGYVYRDVVGEVGGAANAAAMDHEQGSDDIEESQPVTSKSLASTNDLRSSPTNTPRPSSPVIEDTEVERIREGQGAGEILSRRKRRRVA